MSLVEKEAMRNCKFVESTFRRRDAGHLDHFDRHEHARVQVDALVDLSVGARTKRVFLQGILFSCQDL